MTRHLDAVVIGAGPAGLTAARVIAAAGLSCLAIDKMGPGGQLMNMGDVHDCPGLDPGITGPDLLSRLLDEAMAAGVELAVDEVMGISGGAPFRLTATDTPLTATAVVIATGLGRGTTIVADEELYEGIGVSHCATCDGPLFKDKRVVVDGGDDWAVQDAIELARIAAHVTIVTEHGLRAKPARVAAFAALPNAALLDGRIVGLGGEPALSKVVVETGTAQTVLAASGLFVCDRRRPATGCLVGMPVLAAGGHVETDPGCGTTRMGLFACGDARWGASHRLTEAIADGEKAGHNAARWVRSKAAGI